MMEVNSYYCALHVCHSSIPTSVSASYRKDILFKLQVYVPAKPIFMKDLNICVKVLHNNNPIYNNTDIFIQWMEVQRILGVSHVTL